MGKNGKSICVAGMKCFPKGDQTFLDIKEIDFGKKQRGRKTTSATNSFHLNLQEEIVYQK